ncbi:hypothetical protein Q5P01_000512 [Channa striata]|uniref:Uncharacterized protein n=1 Tax=Channa striata TaxID=64152 RepID=A0AA88LMN7_CHASR|nr:hypothetical protein Q5P01_000512 [Channa striata]
MTNSSCIMCAAARPFLLAVPVPFNSSQCYTQLLHSTLFNGNELQLTKTNVTRIIGGCDWEILHLAAVTNLEENEDGSVWGIAGIKRQKYPQPAPSPYTICSTCEFECFSRKQENGNPQGHFLNCSLTWELGDSPMKSTLSGSTFSWYPQNNRYPPNPEYLNSQTMALTDIWWICGGEPQQTLPPNWTGTCTQVMFVSPVKVGIEHDILPHSRKTQGVPDEYKARNQIAAGFESILCWWCTINKNVDWINYIYYNQQRFINRSSDAVEGLAEQLGPTSLMSWQNRMALDMLLAEKEGVCVMFGDSCCTFIPNNTAPDGSVTKALEGLRSLREELSQNSGVNIGWTNWIDRMFGKWKSIILSLLTSILVVLSVFAFCGCCLIPCVRGLIMRTTENALTHQMTLIDEKGTQNNVPLYMMMISTQSLVMKIPMCRCHF